MNMGGSKVQPEELTLEERAYYQEMWGFDPVLDKKTQPREMNADVVRNPLYHPSPRQSLQFYYETSISLGCDPVLDAAWVALLARVDWNEEGEFHNHIFFTRRDKSAEIGCVHTAILEEPPREKTLEELETPPEDLSKILPPWDNFEALKSFVTGIMDIGILRILDPILHGSKNDLAEFGIEDDSDPGINFGDSLLSWEFMFQIFQGLLKIVPVSVRLFMARKLIKLLEQAPIDWLVAQWNRLKNDYNAHEFLKDKEFVHFLNDTVRMKLIDCFLILCDDEYDEFESGPHEILLVLLSGNFFYKLKRETQKKLLDILSELDRTDRFEPDQWEFFSKIFTQLFCIVLSYASAKLLDPKRILKMLYFLDRKTLQSSFYMTAVVDIDYVTNLLSQLISIWELPNHENDNLGVLPLRLLLRIIDSEADPNEIREILIKMNAIAPSEWYQEFLIPLSETEEFEFIQEILGNRLRLEIQSKDEFQKLEDDWMKS